MAVNATSVVSSGAAYLSTTNVSLGNPVLFTAEFHDANGVSFTPTAATLNITYPTGTITTATVNIVMTGGTYYFTATWGSSVASVGLAPWTITSSGPTMQGQLRIISP
jgi:hypothetical protein